MQVCTAKMNLSDEVDLEDYVSRPDKISAAEVSWLCNLLLAAGFQTSFSFLYILHIFFHLISLVLFPYGDPMII